MSLWIYCACHFVVMLSLKTASVNLSSHCHNISSSVHWLPAHAFKDLITNCKTLSVTKPSLIKVCLVIAHQKIQGDNKVREWKWLVCPRFLRLTSLCSVCLSCCCAKIFCLRPRERLCETVNPHVISSGMENSLICQQQSVLSPLKRKWFLSKLQDFRLQQIELIC